ncbi:MAG TPA: hypothetical protein PK360_03515 [bacterium]|nr:hypothetical protein [bacterium]
MDPFNLENASIFFPPAETSPAARQRSARRKTGWEIPFLMGACLLAFVGKAGGEANPRENLFPQSVRWISGGVAGVTQIHSLPDRMEISHTNRGPLYDLYGRGQGVAEAGEDGFYPFTGREGSWSLTAYVQWIDSGDGKSNAFAGLMIRDRENTPLSKMYAMGLSKRPRPSLASTPAGMMGGFAWRISLEMHLFLGSFSQNHPNESGSFIRLTYAAPWKIVYAESSSDGMVWDLIHQTRVEMEEPVQYGLFIANGNDTTTPVHAQFSQVTLEPAVIAERIFPRDAYTPGEDLEVRVNVLNPSEQPKEVVITEVPENSWDIHSISQGGLWEDEEITWSLFLNPGWNILSYMAQPPADYQGTAHFRGEAGNIPIGGRAHLNGALGIFEEVADWGSHGTSLLSSKPKIPGGVLALPSGEGLEYRLQGHGIGDNVCWNEGFFAYVQRSGSWTFPRSWRFPKTKPANTGIIPNSG